MIWDRDRIDGCVLNKINPQGKPCGFLCVNIWFSYGIYIINPKGVVIVYCQKPPQLPAAAVKSLPRVSSAFLCSHLEMYNVKGDIDTPNILYVAAARLW